MNAETLKLIIDYVATMKGVNPSELIVYSLDEWDWNIDVGNDNINWDRDNINTFDKFVKYYEKEYLHLDNKEV